MWPLLTDSNYFKTVSTVMNQSHFQVAMFAFNCMMIITWYNMYSAWFLDIRISTCSVACLYILKKLVYCWNHHFMLS